MTYKGNTKLGLLFQNRRDKGIEGLPTFSVTINNGLINRDSLNRKTETNLSAEDHLIVYKGDIAYNMMRMWQGASGLAKQDGIISPAYIVLEPQKKIIDPLYASYLFKTKRMIYLFGAYSYGLTSDRLRLYFNDFKKIPVNIPSLPEQQKITRILCTWDNAIETAEKLINNSRQQKKALMQQFVTGKRRLHGYNDKWKQIKLKDCAECLDNKRIPLNKEERSKIKGKIPYWGASNIVDYVNDYIFNETIILLAEDGGSFSEFQTKPIANIVRGKSWINNHAHVLRAKPNTTNDWLFYSLVHKNILGFVVGGTRAKLNKTDMLKIPINLPSVEEQSKITEFLKENDALIRSQENDLKLLQQQKKSLMQQIFNGNRRIKTN